MASLRKKLRSPFWYGCFTLPNGKRTQHSTGVTDKKKARMIIAQWEAATIEAKAGRLTEARARKTIAAIFQIGNPSKLPSSMVGTFLTSWLKRKEQEAESSTHSKYTTVVTQFREHLGKERLDRDVTSLTAADFVGFRDKLAVRLSASSCNVALKIIRSAFEDARRDGLLEINEATRVSSIKQKNVFERRPFTLDEFRRLLKVADDEWRGMILAALYTGQRLSDIAGLTWENIDLQRAELALTTQKTGRRQIIPLAQPLLLHLETLPAGDKPAAPLFPRAHDVVTRNKTAGALSNAFYDLLVSAGLAAKKSHQAKKTGDAGEKSGGRAARRERSSLSFHSFRHTATTLLKQAGVGEAVAMEFIGHDSKNISQHYTHIETETLRTAAAKLPDVTK